MTKTKNIIDNLGESHDDPFLNYGNQTALDLWEMDWSQFTQSPFTAYRRTYKPRRMGTDAGTG